MSPRRTAADSAHREPLTRERVLAAALQLIDEEGLDRFSMRRLAARLGVDPMSIYYHLPNKAAVLDGVVEAIMAEFRVPTAGGPEEQLRAVAHAYRDLLRAHPNALPIIATWPIQTRQGWGALETILGQLHQTGVDDEDAAAVVQIVGALINGLVLADVGPPPGGVPDRTYEEKRAAIDAISAGAFPHLAAALAAGGVPDFDHSFELALDLIIRGLTSREGTARDGAPTAPSRRLEPGPAALPDG